MCAVAMLKNKENTEMEKIGLVSTTPGQLPIPYTDGAVIRGTLSMD